MTIENQNQIYTFIITYLPGRSVSRTLSMPAGYQLINLHAAIHEAIEWYGDYGLHLFLLDNTDSGTPPVILCPEYDDFNYPPFFDDLNGDPPLTDEFTLADLKLSLGQKILYLFDDVARYRFEIELIANTHYPASRDNQSYPHIIDARGEMPLQFEDE